MAVNRAQPCPHAAAHFPRTGRGGSEGHFVSHALRYSDSKSGSGSHGREHVVVPAGPRSVQLFDRLLFGRVRPSSIAADLCRRAWRAGRRPLQGSERRRAPPHWCRVHVPSGLFPSERVVGRMAGGALRTAELGGRPGRARAETRWAPLHRGGTARRQNRARFGLARASWAGKAVSFGYRAPGERSVGPRALGAALRRRFRDASPSGGRLRRRGCARAKDARPRSDGVAHE